MLNQPPGMDARKPTRYPAKTGPVLAGKRYAWFHPGGLGEVTKRQWVTWRAEVSVPPLCALDREKAWPTVQAKVDELRVRGFVVVCVDVRGYETQAGTEAKWWVEFGSPVGLDARTANAEEPM
jgi:hypothetical protein